MFFFTKMNEVLARGMVVHACNAITQGVEEGGSGVGGQPGLHSKTLCTKKYKKTKNQTKPPKQPNNQKQREVGTRTSIYSLYLSHCIIFSLHGSLLSFITILGRTCLNSFLKSQKYRNSLKLSQ
jgi:hypothetical protein